MASTPFNTDRSSWNIEVDERQKWLSLRPVHPLAEGELASGLEAVLGDGILCLDGISLELASSGLTHHCINALLRIVELSCTVCRRLDLSKNGLDDDSVDGVVTFISDQTASIDDLDLRDNSLTALGLARLSMSFARHSEQAYPRLEDDGTCVPCCLDLRGNSIDQPLEVLKLLQGHGITTCLGTKCSRRRCMVGAPVHLVGGLARQNRVVQRPREGILDLLGAPLARRQVAYRRQCIERPLPPSPSPIGNRPSCLPPSCSSSLLSGVPPQSSLPEDFSSQAAMANGSHVPIVRPKDASPLSPWMDSVRFSIGQKIQRKYSTASSGNVGGELLQIACASPLAIYGLGHVQVKGGLGSDRTGLAWVNIADISSRHA